LIGNQAAARRALQQEGLEFGFYSPTDFITVLAAVMAPFDEPRVIIPRPYQIFTSDESLPLESPAERVEPIA
jgi:hypothetical protein